MKKLAIIGFGSRGQLFAKLIQKFNDAQLVAVADVAPINLETARTKFNLPESICYGSADEFFAKGKICDAVFICTQDKQHHEMAIKALDLGYDICLEKPAAATIDECLQIRDKALSLGRKVMLTHVLRYAPFYGCIKKLIQSGQLGDVVNIDQTENIAFWHFALSYARGPWRNMDESTPTIIAKCCHDLDIILWLMDKKCSSVSSFGKNYFFNSQNAPKGSAEYCVDCDEKVREKCLYNAFEIYPKKMQEGVVGGTAKFNGSDIVEVIKQRQDVISKCIFHTGCDAIDNQVVNMNFVDGATAHLTMTAFSNRCDRSISVHGTKADLRGDVSSGKIYLSKFGNGTEVIDVNEYNGIGERLSDGHGGGDAYLYKDFIDYITSDSPSFTRTTISQSIESHVLGFKAEESRKNGGKVIEL